MEKTAVGVLLFTNMVVVGLVLGQSLMVISTTGILLYARVCPLYSCIVGMHYFFDRCLHISRRPILVCKIPC